MTWKINIRNCNGIREGGPTLTCFQNIQQQRPSHCVRVLCPETGEEDVQHTLTEQHFPDKERGERGRERKGGREREIEREREREREREKRERQRETEKERETDRQRETGRERERKKRERRKRRQGECEYLKNWKFRICSGTNCYGIIMASHEAERLTMGTF